MRYIRSSVVIAVVLAGMGIFLPTLLLAPQPPPCTSNADCDDGNPCTWDWCYVPPDSIDGFCVHDPIYGCSQAVIDSMCALLDCDDGDPCTIDSCRAVAVDSATIIVECVHVPLCPDDNDPCTRDTCEVVGVVGGGPLVSCVYEEIPDCDGIVPIELSGFRVQVDEGCVILHWATGSETENLGYHVYRCLSKDGEFEKLTAELIEGAGSSRTTQTYQFVDEDVRAGKTYFYQLEQINFDGTKEVHGPVAVRVEKGTAVQPSTWGLIKSLLR